MPGIGIGVYPVLSFSPVLLSLCKNLLEMSQLIKLLKGMQLTNEVFEGNFPAIFSEGMKQSVSQSPSQMLGIFGS